MKKIGLVILGLVVVVVVLVLVTKKQSAKPAATPAEKTAEASVPVVEEVIPPPPPLPPPDIAKFQVMEAMYPVEPEVEIPAGSTGTVDNIEVPADRPLATINKVPITLKDLVPVKPEDEGKSVKMSPEIYDARLKRAIDTELTYQNARAKKIRLTPEQQEKVSAIRKVKQAEIEAYRQQGVNWSSITEEQIALQEAFVAALLLRQSLLEKEGIPTSPSLSEDQIRQYYDENIEVYGTLPDDPVKREQAWSRISNEIADLLLPYLQNQYRLKDAELLQRLRQNADVNILVPGKG